MANRKNYCMNRLKFWLISLVTIKNWRSANYRIMQRWSRGHKARGQGHKKNPRPRTALPRTDTLEAKNRNARGQGHKRKCSPKKKVFTKIFQVISPKNVFQEIFQALHKILIIQKIVLSSSRGQANFRGLEASRPRT